MRPTAWLIALTPLLFSCAPELNSEPPLRPLIYTESAAAMTLAPEGFDEWNEPDHDPVLWPTMPQRRFLEPGSIAPAETPAELLESVLRALMAYNEPALDSYLFSPEGLAEAARMGADGAQRTAQTIRDETLSTLEAFNPGPASQQRPAGLERQLSIGAITLGLPRALDGSQLSADQADDAYLHWGSEITFHLDSPPMTFTLRFPRILKDSEGHWRLQSAPQVDPNWIIFRALGLDLSPRMMDTEHAPWPLNVGNYWHFQVSRPSANPSDSSVIASEGYRLEVTDVRDYERYRVVLLERRGDLPGQGNRAQMWLQTPLRMYECNRECARKARDLEFLLEYARTQTPFLVLPLDDATSWGAGGSRSGSSTWHVSHDQEAVETPAGLFDSSVAISRATARGRETQSFVRGIGVVQVETVSASEGRVEKLSSWRILP